MEANEHTTEHIRRAKLKNISTEINEYETLIRITSGLRPKQKRVWIRQSQMEHAD